MVPGPLSLHLISCGQSHLFFFSLTFSGLSMAYLSGFPQYSSTGIKEWSSSWYTIVLALMKDSYSSSSSLGPGPIRNEWLCEHCEHLRSDQSHFFFSSHCRWQSDLSLSAQYQTWCTCDCNQGITSTTRVWSPVTFVSVLSSQQRPEFVSSDSFLLLLLNHDGVCRGLAAQVPLFAGLRQPTLSPWPSQWHYCTRLSRPRSCQLWQECSNLRCLSTGTRVWLDVSGSDVDLSNDDKGKLKYADEITTRYTNVLPID